MQEIVDIANQIQKAILAIQQFGQFKLEDYANVFALIQALQQSDQLKEQKKQVIQPIKQQFAMIAATCLQMIEDVKKQIPEIKSVDDFKRYVLEKNITI